MSIRSSSEYSSGVSYYGIDDGPSSKSYTSPPLLTLSSLSLLHSICDLSACGRRILPETDALAALLCAPTDREPILAALGACAGGRPEFATRTGLLTADQAYAAVRAGTRFGFTHYDRVLARHLADKAAKPRASFERKCAKAPWSAERRVKVAANREPPVQYSSEAFASALDAVTRIQTSDRQTAAPSMEIQALAREALGPDSSPERQIAIAILLEEHAVARLAPYAKAATQEAIEEMPEIRKLVKPLVKRPTSTLSRRIAGDCRDRGLNTVYDHRLAELVNKNENWGRGKVSDEECFPDEYSPEEDSPPEDSPEADSPEGDTPEADSPDENSPEEDSPGENSGEEDSRDENSAEEDSSELNS